MTVVSSMTADELLQLPDDGMRYELVEGELRKMSPAGARHGRVSAEIVWSLMDHLKRQRTGAVYSSETGFLISRQPDTVRAPDAAYVHSERVTDTAGFFDGPPDAAFEVVSPSDTNTEIEEKTLAWLRAGAKVVVIVDPRTKTARIHRTGSASNAEDVIEIDAVIPGWRLPLAELFEYQPAFICAHLRNLRIGSPLALRRQATPPT